MQAGHQMTLTPRSLLPVLAFCIAGPSTAETLPWDVPTQVLTEEALAADLYASFTPAKPVNPGGRRIRAFCATCATSAVLGSTLEPGSPEHMMVALIGRYEAPAGYDDYFRGARPVPPKKLTEMRLDEVRAWQISAVRSGNYAAGEPVSSAAGRYQIVGSTMSRLMKVMGLDGTEIFDAALQDSMALYLLVEAGWLKFKQGEIGLREFGTAVAGIWAAFPALSGPSRGKSVYHGFNGNRAVIALSDYEKALSEIEAVARADAAVVRASR